MNVFGDGTSWLIDDLLNTRHFGIFALGDEYYFVARDGRQVAHHVDVLAWEVLMYEEICHEAKL